MELPPHGPEHCVPYGADLDLACPCGFRRVNLSRDLLRLRQRIERALQHRDLFWSRANRA